MKLARIFSVFMYVVLSAAVVPYSQAAVKVSRDEQAQWLRWVIPLPKNVTIKAKRVVSVRDVVIVLNSKSSVLERNAAKELTALFEEKTQVKPPIVKDVRIKGWNIILGVTDEHKRVAGLKVPNLKRIRSVPNADQAYVIVPVRDNALMLAATGPRGAYYAAKTLAHLLRPTFSGTGTEATVEIPIARIADWPDMSERGLWGTDTAEWNVKLMADRKMNTHETVGSTLYPLKSSLMVNSEGKGVAKLRTSSIVLGMRYAFNVVPMIAHADQWYTMNIFKALPQTRGVATGSMKKRGLNIACFSKEETARVLGDWIVSISEQLPLENRDISFMLSEDYHCACKQCLKTNTYVLQAKAIVQAYERAKKYRPDIKLRVVLSEGSFALGNDKVLAALPREIGVVYYNSTFTYLSDREPIIYPLLEKYAKAGGWLGVYPTIVADKNSMVPWTCAQFIQFRMKEFVDKGLASLQGFIGFDPRLFDFSVAAAAEWSWNAYGRSPREFALAYYTQEGASDPEKCADWAIMLGPVEWDIYGGRILIHTFNGRLGISKTLSEEDKWPELGKGSYRYLPNEKHLQSNLKTCAVAMKLAKEIGDRGMIFETQITTGYMNMLRIVYEMGRVIGDEKELSDKQKRTLSSLLVELDNAKDFTIKSLRLWRQHMAHCSEHPTRFKSTLKNAEMFTIVIGQYLRGLGVRRPRPDVENPNVSIKIPMGSGPVIGVYHGGYSDSSKSLLQAFLNENIRIFMLPRLDREALALCDVVIVPQTSSDCFRFFNHAGSDIRDFVKKGGGIMLTHDAVGYRFHDAVFPEIGKGISHPKLGVAIVAEEHPVSKGFKVGEAIAYAYSYDHVAIVPGKDGTVLMKDKEDHPTVVVGHFGKGRVVLNGMLPGQAAQLKGECISKFKEPQGAELKFLINAIRWLNTTEEAWGGN